LGQEHADRFLAGEDLSPRESAFHALVRASHSHDEAERRFIVEMATRSLNCDEINHANTVIALFNFYNKFVDLHGVSELTPDGYAASGVRLSTHGYCQPATR
jgi:hypothetical protein